MANAPKPFRGPPPPPAHQKLLTPRQFAERWGVDVATVWRWVAKGAVPSTRTPGGARLRIIDDEVHPPPDATPMARSERK